MKTQYTVTIKRLNLTETFDWASLPEQSKDYVIQNGLVQSLNDSIAGKDLTEEARLGLLSKRIDAIKSGTMGTREGLTLESVKRAMAKAWIKKHLPDLKGAEHDEKLIAIMADSRLVAAAAKKYEALLELNDLDLA